MKAVGHPLFFVFAFTVLVCVAGMWWLLRRRRERVARKQSTQPLQEGGRSAVEILQDIQSATISLAQHGTVSPASVGLDKKDATEQQIVKREETKSRLALLDDLIAKHRSRIVSGRTMRLDVTLLEEQLKILTDTREEYYLALKRLLLDFTDCENANGGSQ
jgi:Na+-translocating ferredoxin:NAD+ oxidoreductase RnfC subunit